MATNFDTWLDTLATTDLPQTRKQLTSGGAFCCLGVGCLIMPDGDQFLGQQRTLAPPSLIKWLGLEELMPSEDDLEVDDSDVAGGFDIHLDFPYDHYLSPRPYTSTALSLALSLVHKPHSLLSAAGLNDDGFTFAQIADLFRYFGVAAVEYVSTNFYWHPPDEDATLHIGKRVGAGGGLTSIYFQGHRHDVDMAIDSWAKWKVCLRTGGEIYDEYDRKVEVSDFIQQVETTTPENRRRQYDWLRDHGYPMDREWLDANGFHFTFTEFS